MAGGAVGGAMIGSNAAGKASDAQVGMQRNALQFQQGIYNNNQNNFQPYLDLGKNATNSLSAIYGWDPNGGFAGGPDSTNALQAFTNTPDYQFSLAQGTRALDASAAASHLLTSGGMVRAAQDYGQGLASTQYGNVISRLMSIINTGKDAAGAVASSGAAMGQQIGSTMGNIGNAQAAGIVGQANPWISALNSGPGNTLAGYSYFNNPNNGMQSWSQMGGGASGGNAGAPLSLSPTSYTPTNQLSWFGSGSTMPFGVA